MATGKGFPQDRALLLDGQEVDNPAGGKYQGDSSLRDAAKKRAARHLLPSARFAVNLEFRKTRIPVGPRVVIGEYPYVVHDHGYVFHFENFGERG